MYEIEEPRGSNPEGRGIIQKYLLYQNGKGGTVATFQTKVLVCNGSVRLIVCVCVLWVWMFVSVGVVVVVVVTVAVV